MTVKEVFELRKQGKIEEAYEAIRPMYATHKGKYTTLCMFWTASDILKKRLQEKRVGEAEKIFAIMPGLPFFGVMNGRLPSLCCPVRRLASHFSKTGAASIRYVPV